MKILAVDVGTGTQDVIIFDTERHVENCFKLVMPSPTMMVAKRVKEATHQANRPLLLSGVTMGGGPSHWAVRDHAAAGHPVFATADAAKTFDDDLDKVREMGVEVVSEDEAAALRIAHDEMLRLSLHDFNFELLAEAVKPFGIDLYTELDGVAVAVFDHGAAPTDISDRQFRFDYLDERISTHNRLSAFAFLPEHIPGSMTRLQSVVDSAKITGKPDGLPVMVMDTAPAAVLGATLDGKIAKRENVLVTNVGNFHTLAFRLGQGAIGGVFEHHTGFLNTEKLDQLIQSLADGTLVHEDVFDDHGHGALLYDKQPLPVDTIAVTGPRRSMMVGSAHQTYFAVPYGDMMLAGCFGLIRAWVDIFPQDRSKLMESLGGAERVAPWELL